MLLAIKISADRVFETRKRWAFWVFLGFGNFSRKSPCMKGPRSISFSSLADLSSGDASRSGQARGGDLIQQSVRNGETKLKKV
jgi:hypothetical protein